MFLGSKSEFNCVTFKQTTTWDTKKRIPRLDPWRKEESDTQQRSSDDFGFYQLTYATIRRKI